MSESATAEAGVETVTTPEKQRHLVDIKLFVGRLPTSATEESVSKIFAEYGTVMEVMILRDKITGAHKGSAFVRMTSIRDADQAIRNLPTNPNINPKLRQIQISYAVGEPERLNFAPGVLTPDIDEAKVFIGSLPKNIEEADILNFFSAYGECHDPYLMRDPATKKLKGCGFLKFSQKEDALFIIQQLHKSVVFPGGTRPLELRIAEPKRILQPNIHVNPNSFRFYSGSGREMEPASVPPMRMGVCMDLMRVKPPICHTRMYMPHATRQPDMSTPGGHPRMYEAPPIADSNLNPRTAGYWKEYFTPDGMPYYHNCQTLATQWVVPKEFAEVFNAKEQTTVEQSTGPQGANIFVFHVPSEWTKEDLRMHFVQFGKVVSAMVAIDPATRRNRGYGFVSFNNIASAIHAVNEMNLLAVGNKRLRVAIKIGEVDFARKYAQEHGIPFNQAKSDQESQNKPNHPIMQKNVLNKQHATPVRCRSQATYQSKQSHPYPTDHTNPAYDNQKMQKLQRHDMNEQSFEISNTNETAPEMIIPDINSSQNQTPPLVQNINDTNFNYPGNQSTQPTNAISNEFFPQNLEETYSGNHDFIVNNTEDTNSNYAITSNVQYSA